MAKAKLPKLINIEEDQFPPNSKASRKEEFDLSDNKEKYDGHTPAEIVADAKQRSVKAIRRRKSITRSIKESLFSEDTRNVFDFVISDVLLPAAKSLISDIFTQGIQMMLFGEGGGPKRSRDRSEKSFVNYGDRYRSRDDDREIMRSSRRDRFGLEDIYFRSGKEATDVLSDLCDLLEKYDQVSVQDYFDLAGIDGATHVHAKWGWDSLKKAYCTYTRDGHTIVMPKPIELD